MGKMRTALHLGKSPFQFQKNSIQGDWVCLEGENYYRISNYDRMRPFFISVVSDADHWMFISSNGGLTAGRRDADHALFPYYTDDKIRDQAEITGSKTILRVRVRSKEMAAPAAARCGAGRKSKNTNTLCFKLKAVPAKSLFG